MSKKIKRIAIEATLAQYTPTGMGQYVINLLQELSKITDNKYEFLLLHSNKKWNGPNFGKQFTPISYYFYKTSLAIRFNLNRVLKKSKADLFHATCNTGAPPKSNIPIITTIHDIYPKIKPKNCTKAQALCFKYLLNWSLKSSSHFITVSHFTSHELSNLLNINSNKISTIHLAPTLATTNINTKIKRDGNFFLCVGALDPRKGQLDLIDGYFEASKTIKDLPHLIFVGPDRGYGKKLLNKILNYNLENKIHWLNYVKDKTLHRFYLKTKALIYPSTYEGFGLPMLEAMHYKTPILCSDIHIFREVGGSYPVFITPEYSCWAQALINFSKGTYSNYFAENIRQEILKKFSWQKCAEKTLNIYEMALSNKILTKKRL